MKHIPIVLLCILSISIASAQDSDSLEFIKSRRMSDPDLAKKREGTFFTIIPDFSSDPVTGFGLGIRSNIYWNGERSNPLFAYTPYLARLKANAAYYTSNARELTLSLDLPYYQGTPWRIKVDFKAQQNPANLYFGLTEATLGPLRLPSTGAGGTTYSRYADYDRARKTLRPGGASEGTFVTDALSNRFRETEFMLNLKAGYAPGKGLWRIMGGYEIQHLQYTTFEGVEAEAIDPLTGNTVNAPNGSSLLARDAGEGRISGLDGGWLSILQAALIYDTRDFEPDPSRGLYFEIANEFSGSLIGSQYTFDKLFIQGRAFTGLPLGPRTILAARAGLGNIFGDVAPFFEYQDQWSPDGSVNALGGRQSLRGYRANRFLARSMWFTNVELRVRTAETTMWEQYFTFDLAPFFDAGTVRDRWQDLGFANVKTSYGISSEDRLIYFGIGQIF